MRWVMCILAVWGVFEVRQYRRRQAVRGQKKQPQDPPEKPDLSREATLEAICRGDMD